MEFLGAVPCERAKHPLLVTLGDLVFQLAVVHLLLFSGGQHKERRRQGSPGQHEQAVDRRAGDEGQAGEHGLQADSHEAVRMAGQGTLREVISCVLGENLFLCPVVASAGSNLAAA